MCRLPRLRFLEGAEHHEDCASSLYGAYCASDVGATIADAVDVVEYGNGLRGAKKKVALGDPLAKHGDRI